MIAAVPLDPERPLAAAIDLRREPSKRRGPGATGARRNNQNKKEGRWPPYSEQHLTSPCRKQPRLGLQRIADEKKPRYRGHLAWGNEQDASSSTLVSQPTDDSGIVSETQNPSPNLSADKQQSGSPREPSLKSLTALARSQTAALLGRLPNAQIEMRFDLRGKAAGQVRIRARGQYLIRYNLELLRRGGIDFIERTVPHEVAHVLAYHEHGPNIRPHGAEWQQIMHRLGAEPARCHDYDVSDLSTRRLNYFSYHCGCMEHRLSSIRHNKVAKGQRYLCKRCGEPLRRSLPRTAP